VGLTFDSIKQSLKTVGKLIYLVTEALSDSMEFIGALQLRLSVCLSVRPSIRPPCYLFIIAMYVHHLGIYIVFYFVDF